MSFNLSCYKTRIGCGHESWPLQSMLNSVAIDLSLSDNKIRKVVTMCGIYNCKWPDSVCPLDSSKIIMSSLEIVTHWWQIDMIMKSGEFINIEEARLWLHANTNLIELNLEKAANILLNFWKENDMS